MPRTESIEITPKILSLIAGIDEFKGWWRALGTLAPERLSALRRVATIESVGSSTRIEGSRLIDREVERLLSNVAVGRFDTRDEQEVAGYAEAMELVHDSWESIPPTENHVGQLHAVLLRHATKDERHRGRHKNHPNHVVAFDEEGVQIGIVFETAAPFDPPRLMAELLEWFRTAREMAHLHPLLLIGLFVVTFLEIHPFQDGNGRLSRVLTTLLLLQSGYSYVPYSSLESVVEVNKEDYYVALRRTQGTIRSESPDRQPWLVFFLRSLAEQVRRLRGKMDREVALLAALPALSEAILELAHVAPPRRFDVGAVVLENFHELGSRRVVEAFQRARRRDGDPGRRYPSPAPVRDRLSAARERRSAGGSRRRSSAARRRAFARTRLARDPSSGRGRACGRPEARRRARRRPRVPPPGRRLSPV